MLSTLFSLPRMTLADVYNCSFLALQNYYVYLLLDHYDEKFEILVGKNFEVFLIGIVYNVTCDF